MNYVNSHNTELWNFDVFPDVLQNSLFLNPNRIHPLKRREVSHLVQLAVTDPKINQIIIFGSTTEFRCSSYSDIDLFIEREDEQCIVPNEFYDSNSELDIHYSKNLGDKLRKILFDSGVLVYRRI